MTHVIYDLCVRDGACVEVCPVECIIPGMPADEWPWYYIDPETCIDCGACVPECPNNCMGMGREVCVCPKVPQVVYLCQGPSETQITICDTEYGTRNL